MPVITITGPRQSGKTTLVKQIFPTYTYTNLENPETRQFASENPKLFLQQNDKGIIIGKDLSYLVYAGNEAQERTNVHVRSWKNLPDLS